MAGLQQQLLDKDAELKAKEGEMSPLVQYCRQQEDYLMLHWRWYKDDYQPRRSEIHGWRIAISGWRIEIRMEE